MPANTTSSRTQARTSMHFSTYSVAAPWFALAVRANGSATNEIRDIASRLDRMENKALSSQRVVLSEEKADNMQKLALGAKLDRALDRRMSRQDAVVRPRDKHTANEKLDEKAQWSGSLSDGTVPEPQPELAHTATPERGPVTEPQYYGGKAAALLGCGGDERCTTSHE
ncbi:hypothetical protein B0T10DRAFT_410676 [Thelonectria olida]|uniref:Uncharacterized protein n=1 Tax=Thelonectria olida TaxID=1576542 RepID=A0A9P8VWX6_9HYPO|nr:hypothetical protein B0T10DRAFT_410676 [Thelonectria olida]